MRMIFRPCNILRTYCILLGYYITYFPKMAKILKKREKNKGYIAGNIKHKFNISECNAKRKFNQRKSFKILYFFLTSVKMENNENITLKKIPVFLSRLSNFTRMKHLPVKRLTFGHIFYYV